MDFAKLMQAEISKAKGIAPAANKKYVRRADVEAEREAKYLEEQRQKEADREAKLTKKRQLEEDEAARDRAREERKQKLSQDLARKREEEEEEREKARRRRLGLPDPVKVVEEAVEQDVGISPDEITAELRAMDAPKMLFGETHAQRARRLERLKEQRRVDPSQPVATSLEPVAEAELKIPQSVPNGQEQLQFLYRQLGSYFNLVLREWRRALAQRPDEVKESHQGKIAAQAYQECTVNFKPLFKHFESGNLEKDVLGPLVEIVHAAQERRYVDASNTYLKLSIGNAAWPIGVTMVGIHERSAREKLHQDKKEGATAHIMSDEVTRRFLQSIKRCLSFAQTRWPPDDQLQLMG